MSAVKKHTIFNVRCDLEEKENWKRAAKQAEQTLSAWMRGILNRAAGQTIRPEVWITAPPITTAVTAINMASELLERAKPGECLKRLPKGTYCKSCGRSH